MTIEPSHTDLLQSLTGLSCRDLRVAAGGTLILYIGDRNPATESIEWRFHIDAAWRIDGASSPVLGSLDFPMNEEPVETFLLRLNSIRDAVIDTVSVDSPVHDLSIRFSNEHVLRSFAHFSEGEHWELRHSSGLRLTMKDMVNIHQHNESADAIPD